MQKVVCPYCGRVAKYVDSSVIYYGHSYGMAYHFLLALSAIRVYNQRSGGGGSIRRPSSTELLFRGLALNQLAGLNRDRDPFCQFGMFDQDFQKLFQGFFCFGLVHVVSPPFNIFIIQDFLYIVKGFL